MGHPGELEPYVPLGRAGACGEDYWWISDILILSHIWDGTRDVPYDCEWIKGFACRCVTLRNAGPNAPHVALLRCQEAWSAQRGALLASFFPFLKLKFPTDSPNWAKKPVIISASSTGLSKACVRVLSFSRVAL